jgi:hypothetical protein
MVISPRGERPSRRRRRGRSSCPVRLKALLCSQDQRVTAPGPIPVWSQVIRQASRTSGCVLRRDGHCPPGSISSASSTKWGTKDDTCPSSQAIPYSRRSGGSSRGRKNHAGRLQLRHAPRARHRDAQTLRGLVSQGPTEGLQPVFNRRKGVSFRAALTHACGFASGQSIGDGRSASVGLRSAAATKALNSLPALLLLWSAWSAFGRETAVAFERTEGAFAGGHLGATVVRNVGGNSGH